MKNSENFYVRLLLILLGIMVVIPSHAVTSQRAIKEIPPGFKATLESDRTNYFLGENILLHYRVENVGDKSFGISTGGSFPTPHFTNLFEIKVVSSTGEIVFDPIRTHVNSEGVMIRNEVKPGGKFDEKYLLNRYCRLEKPGTYKIVMFWSLGFGDKMEKDVREVSLDIHVEMPTDRDARRILDDDEKTSSSHKTRLDYARINCSVFLPALLERAQQKGSLNAVSGIRSIQTLEATRALVELLTHTNHTIARNAADGLEWRYPRSEDSFQGHSGSTMKLLYIPNVWTNEFDAPVRKYCRGLLTSTNKEDLIYGGNFLGRVGTKDEIPLLIDAYNRVVSLPEFFSDDQFPPRILDYNVLLHAAMGIDTNLDFIADQIQSPAQALIYLSRHGGKNLNSTHEQEFAILAKHPYPCVRMEMLQALPQEIPSSLKTSVTALMLDTNIGVQSYAFEVSNRMNDPKLRDIALKVMSQTKNNRMRWVAHLTAIHYGAKYESAKMWIPHISVMSDEYGCDALDNLSGLVVDDNVGLVLSSPKSIEEAKIMREKWDHFVDENKDRIQSGKLFKVAELPKDLGISAMNIR